MNENKEKDIFEEKYKRWREINLRSSKNNEYTSILKKYKDEGKIDEEFEFKLSNIQLEDLIAMKLEVMYNKLEGKMLSLKYWKKAKYIMQDGLIKFALSVSESRKEASHLLGIYRENLWRAIKRFGLEDFFDH